MKITNPTAKFGEDTAAQFLEKKGYKIIARNFHMRGGEIDIIAERDNTLIFVEVKTRTSNQFGTPFEAITPWKLRTMIKTAQVFIVTHPKLPQALRMDAIAVKISQNEKVKSIEHLENINE